MNMTRIPCAAYITVLTDTSEMKNCLSTETFFYVFLFPTDNLSAMVLKVDIYRHILVDDM